MKIKICGVTRAQDAKLAVDLGAWAVGLIFVPGSPRRVTEDQARAVRRQVPKGVLAVGVFQQAQRQQMMKAIATYQLDAIQLHGGQPPEECSGFPVPVIKAFSLSPGEMPDLQEYNVSSILLEPVRSDEDRRLGRGPGIEEQRDVWKTAASLKGAAQNIILAGGLHPGNVAEAVAAAHPDAVDVSGGVESSSGIKDAEKLKAFFNAII